MDATRSPIKPFKKSNGLNAETTSFLISQQPCLLLAETRRKCATTPEKNQS